MALRTKASKRRASQHHYTYAITVSFETQYSFTEDEVEQGEEDGTYDVDPIDPTDEALAIFENDMRKHLQLMYPIHVLGARTDFDRLLGVDGEPAIGAAASVSCIVTFMDSKGRLQYIYSPELFEKRRYCGRSNSAKVKKGIRGKRSSRSP